MLIAQASFVTSSDLSSNTAKISLDDFTLSTQHESTIPTGQQWLIIPSASKLAFVGGYSGSPFDGEFRTFTADMYFDPNRPVIGHFTVIIDTQSITTSNSLWDMVILKEDWFFTDRHPEAYFKANQFYREGERFVADGILSLKGISKPVSLTFDWVSREDGLIHFSGEAKVNRLHFAIGEGQWAKDSTIDMNVSIKVSLILKASD